MKKFWTVLIFIMHYESCILNHALAQHPLIKMWDARFGGIDHDFLNSFLQTSDNGFILAGTSRSGSGGDKSQPLSGGSADYWIVKIDSLGNKEWDKDFGGNNTDALFCI